MGGVKRSAKKIVGYCLYRFLGSWLPQAHFRIRMIGGISKWIRAESGKLYLEKCGANVNIYPHAHFSSKIELGNNSDIGIYSEINGRTIIGNDVIMGPRCVIYTVNHSIDRVDIPIKYQGVSEEKTVIIGDGVWIGYGVTILPGVHIGKGSVIGAGAVVAKDIPDWSVAVGNPAKVVKNRKVCNE